MTKKGRPQPGQQERKLTRFEAKASGLSTGILVSVDHNGVLQFKVRKGYNTGIVLDAVNKLHAFWAKDTSGKCGKL